MQIFNLYLVSVHNLYSFHLPFQNQSELEGVDVVNLLDLDDVDHRHRDIDVHLDDYDGLDDVDDDDDSVSVCNVFVYSRPAPLPRPELLCLDKT